MSRQTPESKVVNSIVKYLKTVKGVYFERRSAGSPGFKAGSPDLWILIDGHYHIELEVKAPGGELRPEQIKFRERAVNEYNMMCFTVSSAEHVAGIIDHYRHL